MSQSLTQIYLHIIFSTKHRKPFLQNKNYRDQLYDYIAGICKKLNCPAIIIGGVEDHVHLLIRQSKNITVADFLRELKRSSSIWLKTIDPLLKGFSWQTGYGAFSVSASHVERVQAYIAEQEEHHRKKSFRDEFKAICVRYEVEIDERYVWD